MYQIDHMGNVSITLNEHHALLKGDNATKFLADIEACSGNQDLINMLCAEAVQPTLPKVEIDKMLTLSTAHINKEVDSYITENDVASFSSEYGYIIHVSHEVDPDHPQILADLLSFALQQDCQWLCLDRDANTIALFPTFEW